MAELETQNLDAKLEIDLLVMLFLMRLIVLTALFS
jgi:hypothetical protein